MCECFDPPPGRHHSEHFKHLKLGGFKCAPGGKHVKYAKQFEHATYVQSLEFKLFQMFKMLWPPLDRQRSKHFKHVETRGLNMFKIVKTFEMLAVRQRPQQFKPCKHV